MTAILLVDAVGYTLIFTLAALIFTLAAVLIWDMRRMRRDDPARREYLGRVVARSGRLAEDVCWRVLRGFEAGHARDLHLARTAPGAQWYDAARQPDGKWLPPKLTVISNDSLRVIQ